MAPMVFGASRGIGGVFFLALGLLAYWLFGLSRHRGWVLGVLLAAALACVLWGAWLLRQWLQDRRAALRDLPPGETLAGRPWLRVDAWRRREIVAGRVVGTPVLLLAYLFFGGPALFFLWLAVADPATSSGESLRVVGLLMGSVLGFIVAGLTYWRLRYRKYGDSVCRLLTLPGRVGGWLKADVDCALPAGGDDVVIVRLRNMVQAGRSAREVWSMEQRVAVPVQGARTVVPVRLQIPRSPEQKVLAANAGALERFAAPWWVLEVEKQVPGIDFKVAFGVPVYDVPEVTDVTAPLPVPGAPVDDAAGRRIAGVIGLAAAAAFAAITLQATQTGWLSASLFAPSAEWMTTERFRREFAAWSRSHYPASIEGRCADGREEYRSEWTPVPEGTGYYAWYGVGRAWFDRRNREYAAQGFQLAAGSQFVDCAGAERFQGTWIRRRGPP
jgi:hypothetical protein